MSEQAQQKSYKITNNVIVIPMDMTCVAFTLSEDNTKLLPITGNAKDTAEEILNKIRRQVYNSMERARDSLRSYETTTKIIELMKTLAPQKMEGLELESLSDDKRKEFNSIMESFQSFLDTTAELMLDFNVPITQINGEGNVDVNAANQAAQNLMDKLQSKQ